MNKNIFENASFGKTYKTRAGKKAIYLGYTNNSIYHICFIEGESNKTLYFNDGYAWGHQTKGNNIDDIISEWYNVDNEKLDEFATLYEMNHDDIPSFANTDTVWELIQEAFKAGYRKAKS